MIGSDPDVRPNTNGVEARAVLRCGEVDDDAGGGVDAAVACANSVPMVGAAG